MRKPELNIVDAVLAMEGNGPGSGDPRQVGVLLAGENAISVDIAAARIAGLPEKLLYVQNEALRLGLAGSDPQEMVYCGVSPEEVAGAPFRLPHISDVQFGLPRFVKNRLRQQLTSRPEVVAEKCRLCGACVQACPPEAMRIHQKELHFDYPRCIRCFCCRELCPHDALQLRDGLVLSLIKKIRREA